MPPPVEIGVKRGPGRPRKYPLPDVSPTPKHVSDALDAEVDQPKRNKYDGVKQKGPIRLEYNPHPKQQIAAEAIENGAKIVLFMAGIRSGKSWGFSYECLKQIYKFKRNPALGYIVTPTINMGRIPRRLFIQAAGDALHRYKRASDDGPPNCQLYPFQGQKSKFYLVEFHSGEHPDRMRGASVAWAWLDEAAFMKPEVFDVVLGRVMENDGVIFISTSPSTQSHWTYTEVMAHAAKCGKCGLYYHDHRLKREGDKLVPNDHEPEDVIGDKSIAVIQCATFDNTHLKASLIQKLKERYALKDPIIARRELYGEVCGFEGLVYRSFQRQEHKSPFNKFNVPKDAYIFAGVDFGVNDPMVVSFIARIGESFHVVDEYYYQGPPRSMSDHVQAIKMKCPLWSRVKKWWYDPRGKQESIELVRLGLKPMLKARKQFATGSNWLKYRIETITSLLIARDKDGAPLLRFSTGCPAIINDFESRKWKRYSVTGEDDRTRVMDQRGKEQDRNAGDEPAPGFDHGTDAVEYGCVSEIVSGRYKVESKGTPVQAPVHEAPVFSPIQAATADYLGQSLMQHAVNLAKPKKHDAWSFKPRWS